MSSQAPEIEDLVRREYEHGFVTDVASDTIGDGKVVEQGPARKIFESPQQTYTRALMAAAFDLEASDDGAVRM